MRRWFTADPHFHHEAVMRMTLRPFATIHEHDEHLLDHINTHVQYGDELWIVGDVAWYDPTNILKRIRCPNKHLVWGNHDRANFAKHFTSCQDTAIVKLVPGGQRNTEVFLSHYAHAYWPQSYTGRMHLYGHTHAEREDTLDEIWPTRRAGDCGVDNAKRLLGEYRPFSDQEVLDIWGTRPGHDHVEFYQELQRERFAEMEAMGLQPPKQRT